MVQCLWQRYEDLNQSTHQPFKRQTHKMVKHTLTTNCLSVFRHFVGLALKGLKSYFCFTDLTYSARKTIE